MAHHRDEHEVHFTERDYSLSDARAALRAERDQIAADRAEVDRLLAEARDANQSATRDRDRARKLAARFVRRGKHRLAIVRKQLEEREAKLAEDRQRFHADANRLIELRTEFHAAAAATRDRLRDAWASVEAQQARATSEWSEADRYITEQTARLDAREAELVAREKELADRNARGEAETVGLKEEAATIEARVENARAALAELEARRDRARAELLGTEVPSGLPAFAIEDGGDIAAREAALARDKAAVAALKASLEQETAELDDRKRVLAEQFTLLADARAKWQEAERKTVAEMEEMARDLRHREAELDDRDHHLVQADARRRDEAYELWQFRLRLEAWQSKLTAFEVKWHTEREQMEADLETRTTALARRELEIEEMYGRWEKLRRGEREWIRTEFDHWSAERQKMAKAASDFVIQRQLLDAEVSTCAARAMAAEELVAKMVGKDDPKRAARRLAVLRSRWERLFDRKVKEIDTKRAEVAAESASLDERYHELQKLIADVTERQATVNKAAADAELAKVADRPLPAPTRPAAPTAELLTLRDEIERVAGLMIGIELPEPPDKPERDLPWGFEESPTVTVLPFDASARAA